MEQPDSEPKSELDPEALGQRKALVAVDERLRNLITPSLGYQKLREAGKETNTTPDEDLKTLLEGLQALSENINAAVNKIGQGERLEEIHEGTTMIDLKYTNHIKPDKPT